MGNATEDVTVTADKANANEPASKSEEDRDGTAVVKDQIENVEDNSAEITTHDANSDSEGIKTGKAKSSEEKSEEEIQDETKSEDVTGECSDTGKSEETVTTKGEEDSQLVPVSPNSEVKVADV